MRLNQLLECTGDITGIVQVSLLELFHSFLAKIPTQQVSFFGIAEFVVGADPRSKGTPSLALLCSTQVFKRCLITFITVFFGEHQYLVAQPIIKTTRIGQCMVYLGIARLKQSVRIQRHQAICTFGILFPVQTPFKKINASGCEAKLLLEARDILLLGIAELQLLTFNFFSFLEIATQVTG